MLNRDKLLSNIKEFGMKLPARYRFVLIKRKEGGLGIISTPVRGKRKIENEKIYDNQTYLISGEPTAILDIREINSPEDYVDTLIELHKEWEID